MLYTKGERRYTEASAADIMEAASGVLFSLGMTEDGMMTRAWGKMLRAWDTQSQSEELLREMRQREKMLPSTEEIKAPRRGAEPA
jgi:hypothetical protein